mmetsp:Transcript_20997/g.44950  ORF Transcript_20997/g.44950 Transcript_20997/m.44950 type:complete len:281 (+) Transcript_20997:100-942(+)
MVMNSILVMLAATGGCAAAFRHALPSPAGIGGSSKGGYSGMAIPSAPRMSSSSSDNGSVEAAERLRETASRLREEAEEAERALDRSPSARGAMDFVKPVVYSDLNDSCWEITYRFANEPESSNDGDGDGDESKTKTIQRKSYGGKLQIQFRGDGYTDILPAFGDAGDDGSSSNAATFQKVWGWDVETSEEDSMEYLLFSADVSLPPPVSVSERFYFQARVDREGKDEDVLSLQDGSVTVKRNVEAPGGGWWGVFRGAEGILAQFREVGGFRCRAVAGPDP